MFKSLLIFLLFVTQLVSLHAKKPVKTIEGALYTTLLPIISNLKNNEKKFLKDYLTNILKNHKSIRYKHHKGFAKIFKKYERNLKEALYNETVIKTVSERLLVGSMIRVEVDRFLLGYNVSLDIVSHSNEILFHREKKINQTSIKLLSELVGFWIDSYIQDIPYDATILGVRDDKILIDYPGKQEELFLNKQFTVVRRVIDPRSEHYGSFQDVAYGIISEVSDETISGEIIKLNGKNKVKSSDFLIFKIFNESAAGKTADYQYRQHDLGNYRKHGKISLYASLLKVSGDETSADFTGALLGLDFFLPSSLLLFLEFGRRVGQVSGVENDDSNIPGNSLDDNSYKVLLGYSMRPRKWKFISYIDLFAGWSVDQSFLSGLGIIGVGDVSFKGAVIGFRMEHPLYKDMSALTSFQYSINPRFEEQVESLGEAESTTGLLFQLGLRYRFKNSGLSIEGLYRKQKNTADIKDSPAELDISTNQFLLGISNFF